MDTSPRRGALSKNCADCKPCLSIDTFYLLLTQNQFWAPVGAGVELSKLGGSSGKWTIGEAGFFKSM